MYTSFDIGWKGANPYQVRLDSLAYLLIVTMSNPNTDFVHSIADLQHYTSDFIGLLKLLTDEPKHQIFPNLVSVALGELQSDRATRLVLLDLPNWLDTLDE